MVTTSHGIVTTSILTLRAAGNVVVDIRISVKESVTIAKDVGAASQVDEKEECRGDSKSRKSYRINQCEHIIYRRDHFPFGSHSGLLEPRGTSTVR